MPATCSQPAADRNLLFGVLALQMDFISRDALIRAMNAWVLEKGKPLGQILVEQGALREDAHLLLEALVQKHLEMHGGDPQKSLASVSSLGSVRQDLQAISDSDLHASLARVPVTRPPGEDGPVSGGTNGPQGGKADAFATRPPSVGTPTSSGLRFRVLRPHARGGLGEVFVALDEELHREVALKEIQDRHAHHPESRSRFLLEAEITGGLEHPGIVPVYGLGHYADGRPYYAMRFIRGDSLQDAVRRFHEAEMPGRDPGQRTLELRKLLGRFIDVCNAIAYAHSRGVLHRDLKPGNIMLGQYGETLVVDWGLAKPGSRQEEANGSLEGTLRPTSASGSAPTQMGQALGTPAYMSPEQAAGRLDRLGPASDVYSLGATLYCLLTGKPPFEGEDVGTILQKVQRGDFKPPRQVKGEVPAALEAVCLKAMALKPEDRYLSAKALADEIEHWLADEPVAAYRDPWRVRAGRWVRRHRTKVTVAVATVAVTAVCLAVATVLLTAANQRERTAKEEAQKQQERADRNLAKARKAVEDYCTNVAADKRLKQADLHALRKKLLETAVPFYQEFVEQQGDDPGLQADRGKAYLKLAKLREEMGEIVAGIEECRQGQAIFTDLVRVHPAVPDYRKGLADSHRCLGHLLSDLGQLKEAEAECRQAIAIGEQLAHDFPAVPEYRSDLAWSYYTLGSLLRNLGQHKEAEAEYRLAIAIYERLAHDSPAVPDDREGLADSHHLLGFLLSDKGQSKEAEAEYRLAIAIYERLAQDFPTIPDYRNDLASSHNNLGNVLSGRGQHKEAEAEHRQVLAIREKLAQDFPTIPDYRNDLASSHNNLGNVLSDLGQSKEAEAEHRLAIALREKLAHDFPALPDYRNDLASSHHNLGNVLSHRGQSKEAEAEYRQAIALREKLAHDFPALPDYRNGLAGSHHALGNRLSHRGQSKEAEAEYRLAIATYEKLAHDFPALPDYRNDLALCHNNLANLLSNKAQYKEAEAEHRLALALWERLAHDFPTVPDYRRNLTLSYQNLGGLLRDKGQHKEAEAEYRQALAVQERLAQDFPTIPYYRKILAWSHNRLGWVLEDMGRSKEAEAEFRDALAIREKLAHDFPTVPDYRHDLANSHDNVGRMLGLRGQSSEADAEYRKALALHEKVAHDFPTVPGYRDDLAGSHIGLGSLWENSRRTQAEAAYRRALAICEGLTRDFPTNNVGYRERLAWSHNNVAYILYQKRHFKEAEAAYRRALAICEGLIKEFPAVRGHAYQLGQMCVNLGNLVRDAGRPEASLEWYGRSMTTLQATFGKIPETVDERKSLRDAHSGQAEALMQLGRDGEAVKDWDRAIELDKGPDQPRFRLWRGLALARTQKGDYAEVVADAVALSQAKGAKDKAVYDAARVCALASAAAKKDPKLADQYATRAVELLGKARETGYFKEAVDVEHLKKDSDLDSLRSRDDYKKLVADLEAKTTAQRK